jgi:hypothetical protein
VKKIRRNNFRTSGWASASLVLLASLAASAPQRGHAAACCISATSFGVGRLLIWEDFAGGLQLGHARTVGQWRPNDSLHWNPDGYSEGITQMQPWAIVRLHQRVQLQAWVPILINDRWQGSVHQVAGGFGDIGAAVRFELLSIGAFRGFPSFAVTLGGIAPTGRRVEQTSPPLFAGTTGRGSWGGSLAIESEYAFFPWFVRLDASVSGFLSFRRPDTGQSEEYGPLARVGLSTGREIVPGKLVAALAVLGEWEGRVSVNGATVPGSDSYLYSLAGSLSWRFDPHWTLVGTVANSVWPDGFGMNQDARIGFTLGGRYGHF